MNQLSGEPLGSDPNEVENAKTVQPLTPDSLTEFTGSSKAYPTVDILRAFKRERRGSRAVQEISQFFAERNFRLEPPIGDADYYGSVEVRREASHSESNADERDIASAFLSALKNDGVDLDCLYYGMTLEDAVEQMSLTDRTKMPLFFDENDKTSLIGTVLLSDIASELARHSDRKLVELATLNVPCVRTSDQIQDWIPAILEHGFIYGKDSHDQVVQIYTAKDVAKYLHDLANMFLRAYEVENLIRQILEDLDDSEIHHARSNTPQLTDIKELGSDKPLFSPQDLSSHNSETEAPIEQLTFADYMKCLADEAIWGKHFASLDLDLDRDLCIKSLNDARLARNHVMHYGRQDKMQQLGSSFECLAVWLRKVAGRVR